MPIDPDKALGATTPAERVSWTVRDVLLYHLSLGAGTHAATDPELPYTYERGLRVLPTFAMVAGRGPSAGERAAAPLDLPGLDLDPRGMLHAGQALTLHRPLPSSGTADITTRVAGLRDKGKAALVTLEQIAADPDGAPLWTATMDIWARGEGGFGGDPGTEAPWRAPDRAPDQVVDVPTTQGQALLYRLNGDLNPLHADPAFAASAGFERPVLHGLASYGVLAKTLVDRVLDGDTDALTGLSVRFAGPLLPGETLRTAVWRENGALTLESTCPERDGAPVLSRATAEVTS
ncbi:MaoC/PaaZ C-terminal domain-containing protein [Streptomyces sp. NBC_01267]|uniref:MaoC/PaaZ C-terminal domain-containing protein n=1 Tax=unclassified Streptomyces TaxID=2593676 RepID=UPI002DD9AE73|nr:MULTISPECIES: MaoC/PaaZ C-terminal domain-containing protein [unclassified Streptomyces]WSC24167.1 MaoC/PaaZ C-terminal domain-containing protein [Streptomyces sp. NBC_01766]WSV58054.1 MaoC/PaaZ C-terminal domain-containing protein [Streptomyces sp. NBC_01014]